MNLKPAARIGIDFAMSMLLLCAFAYRITGDAAHEWIGVCVFALIAAHNIINLQWYKNMFKGKYNPRRFLMTAVNLLLALAFAVVLVSGLMQSRAVLAFLHLPGGVSRQAHTTAAYWCLPLIGAHIGLHWQIIMNGFGRMAGLRNESRVRTWAMRILGFALIAFAVWSSFDRDIFSKLFLGFSFDYWPEERPGILFFAEMLSVMGIYVFSTHYALIFADWLHHRKIQDKK